MSTPAIATALTLAAKGLAVFPCKPRSKEPATSHGCNSATTDRALIFSWWNSCPEFNVAVATGARSGVFAVDVDSMAAEAELAKLEAQHGEALPPSVETITPKGRHILLKHPGPAHRIPNSASKLAPGVDVRGDAGYILCPPSIHPGGRSYFWSVDSTSEFAQPPAWLLTLIAEPANSPRVTPPEEWRALSAGTIAEGKRNSSIARFAGHLLRKRVDPHVVFELMISWNAVHCVPPLDDEEVATTVSSICTRELQRRQG